MGSNYTVFGVFCLVKDEYSLEHCFSDRLLGEGIRLSVSDDGTGLPDDYEERGHGFANMARDAGRLGGTLVVEKRGRLGGASVTCMVPPGQPA